MTTPIPAQLASELTEQEKAALKELSQHDWMTVSLDVSDRLRDKKLIRHHYCTEDRELTDLGRAVLAALQEATNEPMISHPTSQAELNKVLGAGNHRNAGMLERWAKNEMEKLEAEKSTTITAAQFFSEGYAEKRMECRVEYIDKSAEIIKVYQEEDGGWVAIGIPNPLMVAEGTIDPGTAEGYLGETGEYKFQVTWFTTPQSPALAAEAGDSDMNALMKQIEDGYKSVNNSAAARAFIAALELQTRYEAAQAQLTALRDLAGRAADLLANFEVPATAIGSVMLVDDLRKAALGKGDE